MTAPAAQPVSGQRGRLIDAAADLFAQRGYAGVSVQAIADRVGITPGAIYRHFGGKRDLLDAVVRAALEGWVTVTDEIGPSAAAGSVRELVEGTVQLMVDRPTPLATYLRDADQVGEATAAEVRRLEGQLTASWEAALRAAQPGIGRAELAVRRQAINGALSSLGRGRGPAWSGHLSTLVVEGLVALAEAPPSTLPSSPRPTDPAAWAAPETRRQRLLGTAVSLFAEHGYQGVSLNQIGEAAGGIAGASIAEWFPNKADLLLDAFDLAGALVVAGATSALEEATDPSVALDGLLMSFVGVCATHHELITVTSREGSSLPEADRPRLARRRRQMQDTWALVLRDVRPDLSAGEARLLARCAYAAALQVARHRRADAYPAESTASLLRAFLTAEPVRSRDHAPLEGP